MLVLLWLPYDVPPSPVLGALRPIPLGAGLILEWVCVFVFCDVVSLTPRKLNF